MSIPAVHFKNPPRGNRPRPQVSHPNTRRSHPQIRNISFSSDSDYDLPVIKTKPVQNYQEIAEISEDSDNSKSNSGNNQDSDGDQNQVDWGSKKSTNHLLKQNHNQLPERHLQKLSDSSQADQSPMNSESNQSNVSNSDSIHHKVRRRVRKVQNIPNDPPPAQSPPPPSSQTPPPPIPLQLQPAPPVDEAHSAKRIHRSRSNTSSNGQNPHLRPSRSATFIKPNVTTHVVTKTVDLRNPEKMSNQQIRAPIRTNKPLRKWTPPEDEFDSFTVVKEGKRSSKKDKADYRLMHNEAAIHFAKLFRDDIGQYFGISRTLPVMEASADNIAILRKQNHGARYTIYVNSEKMNDDRDAELLGMAFVKIPAIKTKQKRFRISIKENCEINYPVSKRRELSRIAEDLEAQFEKIINYVNQPPLLDSEGNAIDQFGGLYVVDSQKNYIICNENNQPIFMIFKSSEASYSVKIKPPFNPIMAFGLSIAIIEECS